MQQNNSPALMTLPERRLHLLLCVSAIAGALMVADSARADELPNGVQERLKKQTAALTHAYVRFVETRLDAEIIAGGVATNVCSSYMHGKLFYGEIQSSAVRKGKSYIHRNEFSFDGKFLYLGDIAGGGRTTEALLIKYLAAAKSEPHRERKLWGFRYLDGIGLSVPQRLSELDKFEGVASMVIRGLKESSSTRIEPVGNDLRVTLRIPDPVLTAARKIDLEKRRKELEYLRRSTASIEKEIAGYKRLRELTPERTVSFLLDAEHGYSVREREEWTAVGERIVAVESDDWRYFASEDIWLPGRSITYDYSSAIEFKEFFDEPVRTNITQLTLVEFGSKDLPFTIANKSEYQKAGTGVIDRSVPDAFDKPNHQITYTVAADGTLLRHMARSVADDVGRGRFWLFFVTMLMLPPFVLFVRNKTKAGTP